MKIAGNEPDIIMVTEVIPKAQTVPIADALLAVLGYYLHTNFDPSLSDLGASGCRGVSIYIRTNLKAAEVSFVTTSHIEQLWVQLPLIGEDKLLVGCLYRSPTLSMHESSEELCQLLHTVCASAPSHLLIGGDFNIPHIDWENGFSPAPPRNISHQLLDVLNDCFLTQHVTRPTRFRPGDTPQSPYLGPDTHE